MKKNQLTFLVALTWSIITTILLCLPGSAFPKENWFDKIWLDKWVHTGIFILLVFFWCRSITTFTGRKSIYFIQIAFYFFLYGIAMEFIQKYFMPNRSFDTADIFADGAGSVIGLIISLKVYIKK